MSSVDINDIALTGQRQSGALPTRLEFFIVQIVLNSGVEMNGCRVITVNARASNMTPCRLDLRENVSLDGVIGVRGLWVNSGKKRVDCHEPTMYGIHSAQFRR